MSLNVYSVGLVHISVCAPLDMSREDVEAHVNASHPAGLDHGWSVTEKTFRTGEPNPFIPDGDCGRHWLLTC